MKHTLEELEQKVLDLEARLEKLEGHSSSTASSSEVESETITVC